MGSAVNALVALVGVLVALFLVLFLGGLASAALEVRRERQAGLTPSRPAWERRDALRASGGHRATVRGVVKGLRRDSG